MKKTDTEQIRASNRASVISTLRTYGPLARVEIGRRTRLSPATVSAITSELAKEGIIKQQSAELASNARGRPRVMLDLNEDHAWALGIKLTTNELRLMLGDFKGEIQYESSVPMRTHSLDGEVINRQLVAESVRFLRENPDCQKKLVAINIAVQGFVDAHEGHVVWSPAFNVRNVNLTRDLEDTFHCPVELTNDANCIAFAIREHPDFVNEGNFALVMIDNGVGGSLILDDGLYLGHFGAAAEFGHTKYSHDGPQCACGRRGCIEAYVGDYALYRDACALIDLPATDRRHPSEKQMRKLTQLARDNHPFAKDLYYQAGRVLGFGIANLLALLSPEKVVISGAGVRALDVLEPGIRDGIDGALVPELGKRAEIIGFPWSEDLTGKGAIALALRHFD